MSFSFSFRHLFLAGTACLLISCAGQYQQMPSQNHGFRVKSLVLHFTAIDYQKSADVLVNDGGGVSAHYLVTDPDDDSYPQRSADIIQLVPESQRAWHAGVSEWQTRNHLNDSSIGVEIVNEPECEWDESSQQGHNEYGTNRLCVFPDYPPAQIEAVISLAKGILARNPDIHPTAVVGHSDIAFNRKNDPGPRFPWHQLYESGVGAWYDTDTLNRYWTLFNNHMPETGLMQAAFHAYGYGITETGVVDENTVNLLSAFQMHFLPWGVSGKPDSETLAALFALLEKYFPNKTETLLSRYYKETKLIAKAQPTPRTQHGQIDELFPQKNRSTREDVNDKHAFKAYQGRGDIIIEADTDTTATIKVNGETLNIAEPLNALQTYTYSLSRRTVSGKNTLSVEDVLPQDSQVNVTIPWPHLIDSQSSWKDRFTNVDALIEQEVEAGFPGAVLLVVKDGSIIKKTAYGYARRYDTDGSALAHPQPMTTDTLFDLASNTKMFATTMALMHLQSQGKLDIDAPVSDYMPEYRGDGRDARTVRDLLSHQSGYGPETRFFAPGESDNNTFYSLNKRHTANLLTTKVPFKIGDGLEAHYSDTNFMLLGLLVERITGMSLDRYCEQFIYGPLGLLHTAFNPLQKGMTGEQFAATELAGNTRNGHIEFPGVRTYTLRGEVHDEKAWYSMNGVSGHAGLFSNVDDIAVMMQLLLNGGGYGSVTLMDNNTIDLFTSPSALDPGFGLGWRRAADGRNRWHFGPYASSSAFGHTGWTGTATVIDPEQDLAIVLLTNARHSMVTEDDTGNLHFAGSDFETGRYGSVMARVYEAILNAK